MAKSVEPNQKQCRLAHEISKVALSGEKIKNKGELEKYKGMVRREVLRYIKKALER